MSDLITISQAAEMAGVHRATIRRRVREGDLQQFRQAANRKQRFISRSALEELMTPKPVEDRRAARVAA